MRRITQQRTILPLTFLLILTLTTSACYTTEVVTGEPPSNQTIEKPWATGFINGLVGPGEIDAAQRCDAGVARVKTEISFLNQVVTGLTFGLYSPMSVTITCAEGSTMSDNAIRSDRSDENVSEALQKAAKRSESEKKPVYVQLTK